MQYLKVALPLAAMVSGAFANPAWGGKGGSCLNNACLAAVTGKGALGDAGLRATHCSSYLATTVTPVVTETVTVTGSGKDNNWKRSTYALCPNEVPNYASACDDAAYTSACSCFGYTEVKTTTVDPTTTTKTIWVKPTWGPGGGSCSVDTVSITATTVVVDGTTCPAAETTTITKGGHGGGHGNTVTVTDDDETTTVTVTKNGHGGTTWAATDTVTVTDAEETITVTVTDTKFGHGTSSWTTVTITESALTETVTLPAETVTLPADTVTVPADVPATSCRVDGPLATKLVTNFVDLLQFTSYNGTQGAPGRGYHYNVSAATLAEDFQDISDSINFMAGFPLGGVTFANKTAFDIGQGLLQPEVTVEVLNIWHDCESITWRWRITNTALGVNGINYMEVNEDLLVQRNYAEFDNGAWLQSFGQSCAVAPIAPPVVPAVQKRDAVKRDVVRRGAGKRGLDM